MQIILLSVLAGLGITLLIFTLTQATRQHDEQVPAWAFLAFIAIVFFFWSIGGLSQLFYTPGISNFSTWWSPAMHQTSDFVSNCCKEKI